MSTQVFLLATNANFHRGTNTNNEAGSAVGWNPYRTDTSRPGTGSFQLDTATVAGPTSGVTVKDAGVVGTIEWLSPPVDADVTISGDITANIWAFESSMSANVAINVRIDKVAATNGTITQIVKSTRVTELGTSTAAANFTTGMLAADYTEVSLNKGDRLRITVFGDDVGATNMASGFTFSIHVGGGTGAGTTGDSFVTFTETFGFQTTDPSGTTIYPTNNSTTVATSDNDYEAWTSRGDSAVSAGLNTAPSAWTGPTQVDIGDSATKSSWFTKPLQAFTLGGLVKVNLRAEEDAAARNASVGVQIARVDGDGTNAVVWGYANRDAATTSGGAGEVALTETAYTVYVAGDDLSVSDGQRLRIRLFIDDCADVGNVGNAHVWVDGPTGGASGDTYLIFGQTLTEAANTFAPPPARHYAERASRDFDPWSVTGWL